MAPRPDYSAQPGQSLLPFNLHHESSPELTG